MTSEQSIDKRVISPRVDVGMACADIDHLIRRATGLVDTLVLEAEDLQEAAGQLAIKGIITSNET